MRGDKNIHYSLAEILRNIGRKECLEKAEFLERSNSQNTSLSLRDLGLKASEIQQLAIVIGDIGKKSEVIIDSISFSYNSLLKDEGAITLIKSLPKSLCELGLVNCGIEEVGGQALLDWVQNAPNLKMICAEDNSFSNNLKLDFKKFSKENPEIIVVI